MYQCPKCSVEIIDERAHSCPDCQSDIIFCEQCKKYSELVWEKSDSSPEIFVACNNCKVVFMVRVRKSDIYKYYNFAFKFVNKFDIPYISYLSEFPFGEKIDDIGVYVNDFMFESDRNERWAQRMGTDFGTARAYKVAFQNDSEKEECIVLTHESGLEVFLIAVGTFIGTEGGKLILKHALETIEKNINKWWNKNKTDEEPLVEKIAVRTPYWEISIDGRFTQEERERLIEHIASVARPTETIEEFVTTIDKGIFKDKILTASKKIIKQF